MFYLFLFKPRPNYWSCKNQGSSVDRSVLRLGAKSDIFTHPVICDSIKEIYLLSTRDTIEIRVFIWLWLLSAEIVRLQTASLYLVCGFLGSTHLSVKK
jgi:hypothetical protein